MWFVILVAVVVPIVIDAVVIFLSVTKRSDFITIICDSLITFVSLFLQVFRIYTIRPNPNRSFPYIKQLLVCVFIVVVGLSIAFTFLFARHHNNVFSLLTRLTCFFHATLVEVCLCS